MTSVKVACLDLTCETVTSLLAYRDWLAGQLAILADQGVSLVLLPAGTGMLLYKASKPPGLNETFPQAVKKLATRAGGYLSDFHDLHRMLARRYNIYLAAGSTWLEQEGTVKHIALLYGPGGGIIGQQAQTHLYKREKEWGWGRGSDLKVWSTHLGRLGMVVGSDAWYPEVGKILCQQGAQILLAPAMVPGPAKPYTTLTGMWQQVQQNQVFALDNWLGGQLVDLRLAGWCAIMAPCEQTPDGTGFLAPLVPPKMTLPKLGKLPQKPLMAKLDFNDVDGPGRLPLGFHSPTLYFHQKYVPHIYEKGV